MIKALKRVLDGVNLLFFKTVEATSCTVRVVLVVFSTATTREHEPWSMRRSGSVFPRRTNGFELKDVDEREIVRD